jgi:hypothetical protein
MKPKKRHKLFIGSSKESIEIARAIQAELAEDAYGTVWDQGIFKLSEPFFISLLDVLERSDFGVFVLSPDDLTKIREEAVLTARDNVIFELGLFFGKLGRDRTFYLIPDEVDDLHLPTDLLGITYAKYYPNRIENNLRAAVGPACLQIREHMRTHLKSFKEVDQLISEVDVENLSGIWYAAHLSRSEKGAIAISQHKYELEFSEVGKVTGKMKDVLSKAKWTFNIEGEFTNEGVLVLILRSDKLGLLGAQFHYILEPDGKNIGVITSYDRQNVPFTTLVVFSRNPVEEADLNQEFTSWEQSFIVRPQ